MSSQFREKLYHNFKIGLYDGKPFGLILKREAGFGVSPRDLEKGLSILIDSKKIYFKEGKYYLSHKDYKVEQEKPLDEKFVQGVLRCNEKGFAFITTEDGEDYFVSPQNLGQALHGDTVQAVLVWGRGTNDSVRVVKVLKRGITTLVGTLFHDNGSSYVRPDEKAYLCDIFIPDRFLFNADSGDKVFIEITEYPINRCPIGKIISIIGKQYELATEENSIIISLKLNREFDEKLMQKVRSISQEVGDNEVIGRLNLENEQIFTIDGDTAKDFDDAVSIKKDEKGHYHLGVHIADVSNYVSFKGEIDKEAFERGTSVYFPDRVIPMLPFELSNGICSLNEGVRRLTLSVFMEIDTTGEVVDTSFAESYIKSVRRMTYKNVDKILEGDKELCEKYSDILDSLLLMDELREVLENARNDRGYINLSIKEAEISFEGEKFEIELKKPTRSTKLIEQFMVLANEAVANYLFYQSLPCIYRVHEKITPEKLDTLKKFLNALGIKFITKRDECYPKDIQKLLSNAINSPFFAVVNRTVLRSMQKAKYSTENLGHFGLASKCYCHFTSPIRRYPDLCVHRVLKASLNGRIWELIDLYEDFCQVAADNSSKREKIAEEAERAVDDLYKAKYLQDKIGETHFGVISGVVSTGFFVELDNTCEGFVPLELLPKGKYSYDRDNFSLSSKSRTFKLGQKVKIVIVGVDLTSRRVDFALA